MGGDVYPPGFVAAQGDAAGRSLRARRGRAVRHAWPALAMAPGPDFDARFDTFAGAAGAPAPVAAARTSAAAPQRSWRLRPRPPATT